MITKTDWDTYYNMPFKTASFSRRITEKKLIDLMKKHAVSTPRILELGGANSCFHDPIQQNVKPSQYFIVDNNETGLRRFKERCAEYSTELKNSDLLSHDLSFLNRSFDIVYSVGLIEHFDESGTSHIIQRHFEKLEVGGIVIITYPTPTFLYRATRGLIEGLGKWIFTDERPLNFSEVKKSIPENFELIHKEINWPIILTQEIIVLKKLR